jgi:tight adherence protein C
MDSSTLLAICVFGFVASLTFFAMNLLRNDDEEKLRSRLQANDAASPAPSAKGPEQTILTRLSQFLAQVFMPTEREKISSTRRKLGYAGIYSASSVKALYGFKFIFLVIGFAGGYVLGTIFKMQMIFLPLGALIGLYAPVMWLRTRVKRNQRDLDYGLADALDLMVVCVEAGLAIDASMQRVGQELAGVHPAISREMGITHMETRIGLPRVEALRNLGTRTGSVSLQALAAMLTQAERFGTSIGQALRVHAESLRVARSHRAEELAAQSNVKMTFPLVLFIFPATFLVLAGPTVIHLMNSPMFK